MSDRILTALPVFNEESHVQSVIAEVIAHADDVLVVNDGSTDETLERLAAFDDQIIVESHESNRGYGAALNTAFQFALKYGYDILVTIDCDGQHQPGLIGSIAATLADADEPVDMVSGSRYLRQSSQLTAAPEDRRKINMQVTRCLNETLGLNITDAFCGFKAYRVSSLADLDITEEGYAMPLQLWVQAADIGWNIVEFPVPLLYLDEKRSFGGSLDDARVRMEHYRKVLNSELARRGMSQRFTADCGKSAR